MSHSKTEVSRLQLDDALNGIQEKYLTGQLCAQESLSELDIRRFIFATNMEENISVARCEDTATLNALLTQFKHKFNQPGHKTKASVAVLLDATHYLGLQHEACWFALVMTVDPIAHKIDYHINVNHTLDAEALDKIHALIRQLISEQLDASLTVSSHTTNQMESIAGTYKMLHELYRDPVCKSHGNQNAQDFAKIPATDFFAIKQAVYKAQLTTLLVRQEDLPRISPAVMPHLDQGKMTDQALARQINFLSALPDKQDQHWVVIKRINELRLFETILRFPGEQLMEPLTAHDYFDYLALTHQRLYEARQPANYFNELVLSCFDSTSALMGLITYQEKQLPFPFKTLTLDLQDFYPTSTEAEHFLFTLKTLLVTLASSEIVHIRFLHTTCLSDAQVRDLVEFIRAHSDISMDITLPAAFETQASQQQLDQMLAPRILTRKMTALQRQQTYLVNESTVKAPIRKRPKVKVSATIDIEQEQEQEQQQQKQVAVESESELSQEPTGERSPSEFYTIETFAQAWQSGAFSEHANSHVLDSSKKHAYALWCKWIGAFHKYDAQQMGILISKTACEELLRYNDAFSSGIDQKTDRIPAGFSIKKSADDLRIDFNARLKCIAKRDPLILQTREPSPDLPLSHEQVDVFLALPGRAVLKNIWQQLNDIPYNKESNRLFRQYLPQLLLLDPAVLKTLLPLITDIDNSFNPRKLHFLITSASAIQRAKYPPKENDTNVRIQLTRLFKTQPQIQAAQKFLFTARENPCEFEQHALYHLLSSKEREQIKAMIAAHAFLNLNGLLQLYLQFGSLGLNKFSHYLQHDKQMFADLFANQHRYDLCLHKDFEDALQAIEGFKLNQNERRWWSTLFKRHCAAQTTIHLPTLVNAFTGFKAEIAKLIPGDIVFPESCEFASVTEMTVALSRAASLLKHCDVVNRKAQLGEIAKLDLSSTGMIKAISALEAKQWAFITAEMQMNQHTEAYLYPSITAYTAPKEWRKIAVRSPYKGINLRRIPKEISYDMMMSRYRDGYLFWNYTPHNYTPQVRKAYGSSSYFSSSSLYHDISVTHPGETDEEYMDRIDELMEYQDTKFVTQDDFVKLGFDTKAWYSDPEWSFGYNIHFKDTLPKLDDDTYVHAFIYVKPNLYYIHPNHYAEPISIDVNRFETRLEKMIQMSLTGGKRDFLEQKLRDWEEAETRRRGQGRWYYYQPPITLNIIQTPAELKTLRGTDYYVFIESTQQIFRVETGVQLPTEILLSQIDPHQALKHFDRRNITSWFVEDWDLRYSLLYNYNFKDTDRYSLENTTKNYFRYAAYQAKQGGMSLDVYQHAHQRLTARSDFSNQLKCLMYQTLAGVLYDAHDYIESKAEIKSYIDELVTYEIPIHTFINTIFMGIPALAGWTIDAARIDLLRYISAIDPLPPLPLFKKFMVLCAATIQGNIDSELLRKALSGSNKTIYNGMRDYTDEDFEADKKNYNSRTNLLLRHMQTVEAIRALKDQMTSMNKEVLLGEPLKFSEAILERNEKVIEHLHTLISTFQLTMRCDIESVQIPFVLDVQMGYIRTSSFDDALFKKLMAFYNDGKSDVLLRTLSILRHIDIKKSKQTSRLSQHNFEAILIAVKEATVDEVYEILNNFKFATNGKYLRDYYPDHLVPKPNTDYTIPEAVVIKLKELFTDTDQRKAMESFLRQFRDATHYELVVTLIGGICNKLPPSESRNFLRKLIAAHGLVEPQHSLDPDKSPFVKLLREIHATKQHDLFIYFIEAERTLFKNATPLHLKTFFTTEPNKSPYIAHLAERMLVFAQNIKPSLDAIRKPNIPQVELVPRLLETLLKTPIDELHQEGCSLLRANSVPTDTNLAVLPIPYHAAYLCVGADYYYVNKSLNLCKKLTLSDAQQGQFDEAFKFTIGTTNPQLREINRLSDADLSTLASITQQPHEGDYSTTLLALYRSMDTLVGENPGVKKQFLALFDKTLENYSPAEHPRIIPFLTQFIQQLQQSFANLPDKNLVISLCLLFKENHGEFTPFHLMQLLEVIHTNAANAADAALFTQIAVALISNEKGYSAARFKKMCELAKDNLEFTQLLRDTFYKHAPYPTLQQVLDWHAEAQKKTASIAYTQQMQAVYAAFDKAPVPREASNGFHLQKAKAQLDLFKYDLQPYDRKTIDAKSFHATTLRMRTLSTAALLAILKTFNPDDPTFDAKLALDMETLVAAAAELLHRSKGRQGNSMEINTTQYLAILSMLKSQGHVTNQIATGEGKSRIMMIACACQFARGNTVDFVTSDIHLATRDFVEYQSYFNLIGAPSRLIFSESSLNVYQKRGINFSDPTNLILFRNRARSLQLGHMVIDDDPKRRALLLDEADKTFFDAANSRFNFSSTGDDLIRDMPWVYSLLMLYFSQPTILVGTKQYQPLELYHDNIDLCRETFLQFAYGNPICTEQNKLRLQALSFEKIEEWQAMAYIAKQQIFKEHYDIRPDQLIQTDDGLKMSSEVLLIIANELTETSKLSFGAHQCLGSEHNNLRENPDRNRDAGLKQTLAACDYPFHVPDEKQIIYSSTSKNLLDDYEEGILNAVTGTAGAIMERVEARQLYSTRVGKDIKEPMHFIDVPRERGLKRSDKAIRLTANKAKQLDALVEEIKRAEEKNQPILIMAEDAKESEALYKLLKERLPKTSMLQHVHPKTALKDRNKAINEAGKPKQITISTGMLGRGTDISLKGKAKEHGLLVMTTFLPRVRDMWQYAGRSGRYGDKGEYLAVLDKARLKKALGKSTLTDGFYTNTEDYIQRELAKMDRRAQLQRLIEHTVGDFRKRLTDSFFVEFQKPLRDARASDLLPIWSKFFAQSDQAWNTVQPKIQAALASSKRATPEAIEALFKEYQYKTQGHWSKLRQDIANLKLQYLDPTTEEMTPAVKLLVERLPTLRLSPDIRLLMNDVAPKEQPLKKIKFYDHYDPAHDGRAVKYTQWHIPLIASLKGWANLFPGVNYQQARRPFANFRAWWAGHGQLFADFRASNNKVVIALTGIIGLLAIAAGTAMLLLGLWLAPIYCAAMIAGGSVFVLGVTSGSVGRLIDDLTDSASETNEKLELASWKHMTALHMKKPAAKPQPPQKKEVKTALPTSGSGTTNRKEPPSSAPKRPPRQQGIFSAPPVPTRISRSTAQVKRRP